MMPGKYIDKEGELEEVASCQGFLQVRSEGKCKARVLV